MYEEITKILSTDSSLHYISSICKIQPIRAGIAQLVERSSVAQ